MTLFGATYKYVSYTRNRRHQVPASIYHRTGSLLPLEDAEQRYRFHTGSKQEIVTSLQTLFDQHNKRNRLFRTAFDQIPFDYYKVVVGADKTPTGYYERQYKCSMHQQFWSLCYKKKKKKNQRLRR